MREKLYDIIEPRSGANKYANIYDIVMIIVILFSFIPLVFKERPPLIEAIDIGTAAIFIVDYFLRWATADYKFKRRSPVSFIRYPVSLMAIVDLLSILPVIAEINPAFKLCRFVRLVRAFRAVRVVRIFRYSRNLKIILNVFQKQKRAFMMVLFLTAGYIFISAAVLFQIEPDSFDDFFDAIYWAVILLTTVGYGDVLAATGPGRLITILSAIMGIAIVALPAGIITAGYLTEIQNDRSDDEE